jgi:hypothetical protein
VSQSELDMLGRIESRASPPTFDRSGGDPLRTAGMAPPQQWTEKPRVLSVSGPTPQSWRVALATRAPQPRRPCASAALSAFLPRSPPAQLTEPRARAPVPLGSGTISLSRLSWRALARGAVRSPVATSLGLWSRLISVWPSMTLACTKTGLRIPQVFVQHDPLSQPLPPVSRQFHARLALPAGIPAVRVRPGGCPRLSPRFPGRLGSQTDPSGSGHAKRMQTEPAQPSPQPEARGDSWERTETSGNSIGPPRNIQFNGAFEALAFSSRPFQSNRNRQKRCKPPLLIDSFCSP